MTAAPEAGDELEQAAALLGAATRAGDLEARTLYAARARMLVERLADRIAILRRGVEAVEGELVRLVGKAAR